MWIGVRKEVIGGERRNTDMATLLPVTANETEHTEREKDIKKYRIEISLINK